MPAYRFGDDRGAALPTPTDPAINATQPSQAPTASARRLTPASYSVPSPARPQNRARPLTSHAANPCPPDSNQPVGLRNHATLTRICASWRDTRPAKSRPAKLPAARTRRDPSPKCRAAAPPRAAAAAEEAAPAEAAAAARRARSPARGSSTGRPRRRSRPRSWPRRRRRAAIARGPRRR